MKTMLWRCPRALLCAGIAITACKRGEPASGVVAEASSRIAPAVEEGASPKKKEVADPEKPVPSRGSPDGGAKAKKVPKVAALSDRELRRLKMVREKLSMDQHVALQKETLRVFGRGYSAKPFCPETVVEPSSVEIYSVAGHGAFRIVLCTGSLDGELNVVTVFTRDGRTLSEVVEPKRSSSRIEDPKLRATAKTLLKAI